MDEKRYEYMYDSYLSSLPSEFQLSYCYKESFTHYTIAIRSWRVQKNCCDLISTDDDTELAQNEISMELKLWVTNCKWSGRHGCCAYYLKA